MINKNLTRISLIKRYLRASLSFFVIFLISLAPLYANYQDKNGASNLRLTLNHQNKALEVVFKDIERQTKHYFFYNNNVVDLSKQVTINVKNETLRNILTTLIGKDYDYSFEDNLIVISPKPQPVRNLSLAKAEKVTIKGTVVDSHGEPLMGATVFEKGTQNGVACDMDGNYSISVTKVSSVTLEFSFIGMASKEVTFNPNNQTVVNVVMEEDNTTLSDVVVTGYQKIDRKLFTGSASVVKAEEALLDGIPDVTRSLQGQVSGVSVSNVSGTFGAAPQITIRGNSSLHGTNKPLWVVDGVILEDLINVSAEDLTSGNLSTLLSSGVAGLNPDDIESFQVLKDVSATSLYGAQAMNGVIVITTKSGSSDKLNINYSGSITMRQRPSYMEFDIMNSVDEISIYKELVSKGWVGITSTAKAKNYGVLGKMYDEITKKNLSWDTNLLYNEAFLEKYANANTDWFDVLFNNSISQQHSLSIQSGGKKSRYYASLGYYTDNGQTIADKVDKFNASLKGDFDITSKFNLGVKLAANVRDQKVPGTKDRYFDPTTGAFSRQFDINPFSYALNTARSMRPYDDEGNLEYFRSEYAPFNILNEINRNFVQMRVEDIAAQVDMQYKMPEQRLTFNATGSLRRANTLREHKIHEKSNQAEAYRADYTESIAKSNNLLFNDPAKPGSNPYTILPEGGFYNTYQTSLEHYYGRFVGEWNPTFNDVHIFNYLLGGEINYANRYNRWNDGWGYVYDKGGVVVTHNELMRYLNIQGKKNYGYTELRDRRASGFTNLAYSYGGKYIINAGARYDGSNQLGSSPQARYLPSWNVSGAWNMTEENFIRDINWITTLRPKISYGYNGIMGPVASAALKIYAEQTMRPSHNETANYIDALANENLTWEKMYELNVGLEYGFFNRKISGEIAYYNRKSIDLIDLIYTSGIGGKRIKIGNIGDLKAHGVEFSLTTNNISTPDFSWTTSLNVNFHQSEITKLQQSARIADAISNLGAPILGYPQRGLFSIPFAGLDKEGVPTFYGKDGEILYDIDLQQRENIVDYLKYEGPLEARSYGGLINTFRYKSFGFNFGFVYRWGNFIRLDDAFSSSYDDYRAFTKDLKNRWRLPGDENITTIPAILDRRTLERSSWLNTYELYNKSTERVAKGDFIRLKDVALSYTLPQNIAQKFYCNNLRLSFQATNLWLVYADKKLNGMDPEFFASGGVSLPIPKMYTLTLNIGF